MTSAEVDLYLQVAGWALLRLRHSGHSLRLRSSTLWAVNDTALAYGYTPVATSPPVPTPAEITIMDEACGWLAHIKSPDARRVVALRLLYDAPRGRYVHSYRAIGQRLGCSHARVRALHAGGVVAIAFVINKDAQRLYKLAHYAYLIS
jgi:hypothetical protein